MKVIGIVPARNEAWVLPYSLAALSGFCDAILVCDRQSDDETRAICRQFPKVVLLDAAPESRIREQRWQLLDAARGYDGHNLLWSSDADELVSPQRMRAFLDRHRDQLTPGTVTAPRYYTLWNGRRHYRNDLSHYRPYWIRTGFVDDRRADFDRSNAAALHEPRVPADAGAPVIEAGELAMLHLQWLIPNRNQLKQAWYRGREWLDGKRAADINDLYQVTFPEPRARTAPVPDDWVADLTFPPDAADLVPSWHQRDLFTWFDAHGIEHFEPLEIWHIERLRDEFVRRVGRSPKPDRSYRPSWPVQAQRYGRRVAAAIRRRLAI